MRATLVGDHGPHRSTAEFTRIRTGYCDLMHEVRQRVAMMRWMSSLRPIPSGWAAEFCWVQVRMICETVALGSLLLHGDLEGTRGTEVSKRYQADFLLNELVKLKADAFPKAATWAPGSISDPIELTVLGDDEQPVTRDYLVTLWRRSGRHLHRGTLKRLDLVALRSFPEKEVEEICRRLQSLLDTHLIPTATGELHYLCWSEGENIVMTLIKIDEPSVSPATAAADA